MEDQGEQSPHTFLVNNFPSFNHGENKTIGALSSDLNIDHGFRAAAWTLENKK